VAELSQKTLPCRAPNIIIITSCLLILILHTTVMSIQKSLLATSRVIGEKRSVQRFVCFKCLPRSVAQPLCYIYFESSASHGYEYLTWSDQALGRAGYVPFWQYRQHWINFCKDDELQMCNEQVS
jgi:hypothetical protein